MKKTLFALLVLSGLALGADNTKTVNILTLPGSIDQVKASQHGTGWTQNIGKPSTLTADAVAACLTSSATLAADGWHWSLGNNDGATLSDVTVETATNTINFLGRNGYHGEIVAATMDIETLLSANEGSKALTALTFTFTPTTASQASFSVWHYNSTTKTATSLVQIATLSSGTAPLTYTAGTDAAPLNLTDGKVFVLFNATSAGSAQKISNFSAKATLVPEPATATLSLLALAGLASRRRRK